jgi:uncharacterized UPF0160 family protein
LSPLLDGAVKMRQTKQISLPVIVSNHEKHILTTWKQTYYIETKSETMAFSFLSHSLIPAIYSRAREEHFYCLIVSIYATYLLLMDCMRQKSRQAIYGRQRRAFSFAISSFVGFIHTWTISPLHEL